MLVRLIVLIIVGALLPFLARLPGCVVKGNVYWLSQYMQGAGEIFLIEAFNLIPIAAAVVSALLFRRYWLLPVGAGYGFLFVCYSLLDLASDAQAAVSLLFIPIYSLPFFFVGGIVAAGLWLKDRYSRTPTKSKSNSKLTISS